MTLYGEDGTVEAPIRPHDPRRPPMGSCLVLEPTGNKQGNNFQVYEQYKMVLDGSQTPLSHGAI